MPERMDPAEAERFLRERIAEMASHDDPTNDAAAAVLAALDAARAEVEQLRERATTLHRLLMVHMGLAGAAVPTEQEG